MDDIKIEKAHVTPVEIPTAKGFDQPSPELDAPDPHGELPPMPRISYNPFFMLLRETWRYAGKARVQMVIFYLLYIPAIGFSLAQPWTFGEAINALQKGGPDLLANTGFWLLLFTLAMFFSWVFHGPGRVMERYVGYRAYENFMNESYKKLTELPLTWHQHHHSGEIMNRVQTAAGSLRNFAEEQFVYTQVVMRMLGSIAIMVWIEPIIGILSALVLACSFIILVQFDRRMIRLMHEGNELSHRLSATVFDYVSNMTTLLILRLGQLSRSSVGRAIRRTYPAFMASVKLNEWKYFVFQMIMTLMQSGMIIGYIIWKIDDAGTTAVEIGTLIALTRYQQELGGVIGVMAGSYNTLVRCGTGVASVANIFDEHKNLAPPQNIPPLENWQSLDVSHLCYRHKPRIGMNTESKGGIKDFSATFNRGEKIALIGYSGGGKSSLLGILRGIYPAEAGTLKIDGRDLPLEAMAGITTLIPQDPEIFENTIRFNVTLGLPASDADIMEALELAQFSPVLAKMAHGLETNINEKGVNMSVGQKQRLALARGLFAAKNSSIVLLDEPTSSLDLETEQEIFDNLFDAYKDKTIIATLHRLHLLPQFDRIFLLDAGEVATSGTATDLLRQPGPVRDLFRKYQASTGNAETPEDVRIV